MIILLDGYSVGLFRCTVTVENTLIFDDTDGAGAVVLYPIYEYRHEISDISGAVIRDVFGGGRRSRTVEAA